MHTVVHAYNIFSYYLPNIPTLTFYLILGATHAFACRQAAGQQKGGRRTRGKSIPGTLHLHTCATLQVAPPPWRCALAGRRGNHGGPAAPRILPCACRPASPTSPTHPCHLHTPTPPTPLHYTLPHPHHEHPQSHALTPIDHYQTSQPPPGCLPAMHKTCLNPCLRMVEQGSGGVRVRRACRSADHVSLPPSCNGRAAFCLPCCIFSSSSLSSTLSQM